MAIPFSRQPSVTNLSIASKQSGTHATAQEVYDQLYGMAQTRESVEAALQRIYEPNASTCTSAAWDLLTQIQYSVGNSSMSDRQTSAYTCLLSVTVMRTHY